MVAKRAGPVLRWTLTLMTPSTAAAPVECPTRYLLLLSTSIHTCTSTLLPLSFTTVSHRSYLAHACKAFRLFNIPSYQPRRYTKSVLLTAEDILPPRACHPAISTTRPFASSRARRHVPLALYGISPNIGPAVGLHVCEPRAQRLVTFPAVPWQTMGLDLQHIPTR